MRIRHAALALLGAFALAACSGDFDQRVEEAEIVSPGHGSIGTLPNPDSSPYIRGAVSIGGAVRNAGVTLRAVNSDGTVNWNDSEILGAGVTFNNGIYQLSLYDEDYRGAILVEVRARAEFKAEGGNPATAISQRVHQMEAGHFMYTVVPLYDGYSSIDNHVTPLTTAAVMRGMAFDGSIAGVMGGVGAGMFGMTCRQFGDFFGDIKVRASLPADFARSGGFGEDKRQSFVLAALSQLAKDLGVANVWDFWLGISQDAGDDGELNGSIAFVPNTGVPMPDLGQAGLLGTTLRDNYLDPGNSERVIDKDNTEIGSGTGLANLITTLDTARDINASPTYFYDLTLRVPSETVIAPGGFGQARVISVDQIGGSINFHPYGDSGGPCFVQYEWVSSVPGQVDVLPYGRIEVAPTTPNGDYELSLTVRPFAGQTFVDGPVETHTVMVKVR